MSLNPEDNEIPTMFQLVVPEAVPETPVAILDHVTLVTPMSSDAVPLISRVDELVTNEELEVGEVIAIVGEVEEEDAASIMRWFIAAATEVTDAYREAIALASKTDSAQL